MPLWRKSGSGLPASEPGKVLGTDEAGAVAWVDVSGGLFRGEWTPDEELARVSFESPTLPAGATLITAGQGLTRHDAVQDLPGSPMVLRLIPYLVTAGNYASLQVSLGQLPGALGTTRMQFHARYVKGGSYPEYERFRFKVNGSVLAEVNAVDPPPTDWVSYEFAVDSDDVLEWIAEPRSNIGNVDSTSGAQVGAITFFGAAQPYMRGEFVTYEGKMWESLSDSNAGVPGVAASWREALAMPAPSGPTTSRPDPATAGAGYAYFDTTLNKPIWVNAAASGYVDATGTAV